jgi:hypothetical protein
MMVKSLRSLDSWLDKAVAHAKARGFEPDAFLGTRLAPDQFDLRRQLQSACDTAKFAGARLTGTTAHSDADDETTLEQLRERIARTAAFLEGLSPEAYDGAEARQITLSFVPGMFLTGTDYLLHYAQPNFAFHLTHAYAILRKGGVQLGKMDYLGAVPFQPLAG